MDNYTIDYNGHKKWYNDQTGRLHREDGPAVEFANGDKLWHLNGLLHRANGPAVELIYGTREWYLNGALHREDGPAIIYHNGNKEWHYKGKRINCRSDEEFIKLIKLKVFW